MKPLNKFLIAIAATAAIGIPAIASTNTGGPLAIPRNITIKGEVREMTDDVLKMLSDNNDNKVVRTAEVPSYGSLKAILGDDAYTIDSLIIKGSIDATDLAYIKDCLMNGKLTSVNMSDASIKDNKIPENAFSGIPNYLPLLYIDLPDGITEIGENAFAATLLHAIDIPETVRTLGETCFGYNRYVSGTIVIPEGVEEIPSDCFVYLGQQWGIEDVVLPSTIRKIDSRAFMSATIRNINLPEGLESVGGSAFLYTALKSVTLPKSCTDYAVDNNYGVFAGSLFMESMIFADGTEVIPQRIADRLAALKSVHMPEGVRIIEKYAFNNNYNLKNIDFPQSLNEIRDYAFYESSLEELVLPEDIRYLAPMSFANNTKLKRIICHAPNPPLAIDRNVNGETAQANTPIQAFGDDQHSGTPRNITVYVPKGSVAAYANNNLGWQWFSNFVEMDETVGIDDINTEDRAVHVYSDGGYVIIANSNADVQPMEYAIYTVEGRLAASGVTDGISTTIAVPAGFYIVKAGGNVYKIRN